MNITRRNFISGGAKAGLATATASFWANPLSKKAFAQMAVANYRAVIVITMEGGNDGNNMIVPLDSVEYAEYARIRGSIALPASSLLPLQNSPGGPSYGLHPAMTNIAHLYNQQRAAVVANVGPITGPVTKASLVSGSSAYPDSLFSHPDGVKQWESASAFDGSLTGWGGRMADLLVGQSGSLPPVLNAGLQSLFTVGEAVQAVAVQSGGAFMALPPDLQLTIDSIAQSDLASSNLLVQQAAQIRRASLKQQAIITQATSYRNISTVFPGDAFGLSMKTIVQIIAGNPVVGATRQIFYTQQGSYDSHAGQLPQHASNLQSLDQGLGALFQALDEIGMTGQVLVCTHSDFNRTFTSNTNAGSDHAWGNHQLVMGGGIRGGRILGSMPSIDLNGPDDINGLGIWIPTTAVAQLAGSVGSWMGLSTSQVNTVCPELERFPAGVLNLS